MPKINNDKININMGNDKNSVSNYTLGNNSNIEVEDFEEIEKNVVNDLELVTQNFIKNIDFVKTSSIDLSDGYKSSDSINTENGKIIAANKDGENARLYLYEGESEAGIITLDSSEKIKNINRNILNHTVTVEFENGETRVYNEDRIKRSIELSQKYEGSNVGKYYETDGEKVIEVANAEMGKPYEWGACGPSSYDCSGFVGYCLTGKHERIGTTYTFMEWPETTDPQPGDICVNENHTGIYIGNGQMIHAPQSGESIKVGPVHQGMKYVVYPG